MTAADRSPLGLPQLFDPAEAAKILRDLGLTEMTECALRTRAYRRQVPFHMNGHRVRFTTSDLREIAEGQACRPHPPPETSPALRAPSVHRPSSGRATRSNRHARETWRAREPRDEHPGRRQNR